MRARARSTCCLRAPFTDAPRGVTSLTLGVRSYERRRNFDKIESLSVSGFIAAIERARAVSSTPYVLDIGANMGYYSLVAATLGARVVAVEMQPKCFHLTRCHLHLNRVLRNVTVLNRYVARPGLRAAAIRVPRVRCDTMASPTAVRGRWPSGKLRHGNEPVNASDFQLVEPLIAGEMLLRTLPTGTELAVTKIDTEGFEPHVLEALRPVWHLLNDIVLEVQPSAWVHHNVTVASAMGTFRELIALKRYRAVTLPHRNTKRDSFKPVDLDVCKLPVRGDSEPPSAFTPTSGGYSSAYVIETIHGFDAFIQNVLDNPSRGRFHEFLLTARRCSV